MANEIKILERAKLYIEKLSKGIDPLTDQPVPRNDVIYKERINRCFIYVSEILDNLISEKTEKIKKMPEPNNPNFHETGFNYSEDPISISEITRRINNIYDEADIKRIGRSKLIDILIKKGFLKSVNLVNGKESVRPTGDGEKAGIITKEGYGRQGPYVVVLYTYEAQKNLMQILDNMSGIKKPLLPEDEFIYKNRKWLPDEEDELITMYKNGANPNNLACYFYRSEENICSRLVRLGVIKNRWEAYDNFYNTTSEKNASKQTTNTNNYTNRSPEPVGATKNKYPTGDTERRSDSDPLPKDIRGNNYRPYRKKKSQ